MTEDRLKEIETFVHGFPGKRRTAMMGELIAEVRRLQEQALDVGDVRDDNVKLQAWGIRMERERDEARAEVAGLADRCDGLQHHWDEARAEVERLKELLAEQSEGVCRQCRHSFPACFCTSGGER